MMRQHSWIPIGGVILCLALFSACRTTAALELSNVSIITQSGNPLSLHQVGNGILHAGVKLGWTMKSANPGEIIGTFAWRRHSATVFIGTTWLAFTVTTFAVLNIGLVVVWIVIAILIGKRYGRMEAAG